MAENIEPHKETSESVRFYIAPRGSGSINLKKTLTDEVKLHFRVGKDLHATFNPDMKILTIKEM
jgi:hypothetical protein